MPGTDTQCHPDGSQTQGRLGPLSTPALEPGTVPSTWQVSEKPEGDRAGRAWQATSCPGQFTTWAFPTWSKGQLGPGSVSLAQMSCQESGAFTTPRVRGWSAPSVGHVYWEGLLPVAWTPGGTAEAAVATGWPGPGGWILGKPRLRGCDFLRDIACQGLHVLSG